MIRLKELLLSPHKDVVGLFESPMKFSNWTPDFLETMGKNTTFTIAVEEKGINVGKFKEYDLYEYMVGDNTFNVIINGEHTIGYYEFKLNNDIVNEIRIWQDNTAIGLIREFIFDYILKKYKGLLSDDCHSEMGQKCWKKLIITAHEKEYKVFIVIKEKQTIPLNSNEDIDKYFIANPKGLDYKFLILST